MHPTLYKADTNHTVQIELDYKYELADGPRTSETIPFLEVTELAKDLSINIKTTAKF